MDVYTRLYQLLTEQYLGVDEILEAMQQDSDNAVMGAFLQLQSEGKIERDYAPSHDGRIRYTAV